MKSKALVTLILKAVALAMGVVVVVLSVLQELEPAAGMSMLGIGLACLALASLSKGEEKQ